MASHRLKRTMRGLLTASAVAAAIGLLPAPATADPNTPTNASDAQKQLADLGRQAEIITEQYHQAQDALAAKQADLDKMNVEVASAKNAADAARGQEDQYRNHVDQLAGASYQGARFDQLAAVLTSGSTQQFLDQMSALDVLAANSKQDLGRLSSVVVQANDAQRRAEQARALANQDAADAAKLAGDLDARKKNMDQQVKLAQDQLGRLTAAERAALKGPVDLSTIPVPSGTAGAALAAALGRRGSPYVWGATGPSSFDCSGLVYWAYQQVGITLPRSSSAQSQVGSTIPRGQIQAGDLVFFYSPVSHVGIAIDNGRVVHAPQPGEVVKIESIDNMPFNSARRLGG